MKKILFLVFISLVFLALYYFYTYTKAEFSNFKFQISNSSPSPSLYSSPTVSWNDITYAYEYFEVNDLSKLTLIANFSQQKSSESIISQNNCQYAINGGFYDTNNQPLGLFTNSMLKTLSITSALVNGYIAITHRPTIDFDFPEKPTIALQTGPMLMMDGKKLKLTIKNDEYARRMIAGITSKGTLLFMTIFVPETKVQGPQLADLPDVLERTNVDIVSAINLDGGNASIFKNKNSYIPEVSSVGSLFCLKK